jgi:cyclohexadienyl dehydratase
MGRLARRVALCALLSLAMTGRLRAAPGLDAILAAGVLRVGLTGDYKPFSFRDPQSGAYSGIDVDMAQALAAALGVKLEIVPTAWPTLSADLSAGKFDIAMGGITINLPRSKTAFFSTPVMTAGKTPIALCTNKDKFQTIAQIDQPGVTVIVNPGGTNESFDRATFHAAKIELFPDNATIFDELAHGHGDVMITDGVETRLQQKLHPELCAIHPDEPFTRSELGYMLPRDTPLKLFVDEFLREVDRTGEHAMIVAKWLN